MPVSEVIPTSEYAPEARYRPRDRGAAADRPTKAEAAAAGVAPVADASGPPFDAIYYASRFKTDLSQLKVFDGAEEAPNPPGGAIDSALLDFFGNLSVLLVAVRAGDISRAQAAADALELDALVEHNGAKGASAPLLDDLVALLSAAQSHDETAAREVAKELASDFQSAIAPVAPAASLADAVAPDDGGAAYDTLTLYLDGDADAV